MATFRLNSSGIGAMAVGPEVTAMLIEVADKGKAFAEGIAPRDTGEYASSFDVTVSVAKVGRYRRSVAKLQNNANHAAALEFGNKRTRGRRARVLGKTLTALRGL